ncbi:hypothetical protein ACP70R_009105 [Stipagrostis hirtigluma subsp. patula]
MSGGGEDGEKTSTWAVGLQLWRGLEVKPGATVRRQPGDDYILHLTNATLGESKKGSDHALIYAKVDERKLVMATLSADMHPQIRFKLVFHKDFELSHTSKEVVVIVSLTCLVPCSTMDFDSEEDEDVEELNIAAAKKNVGDPSEFEVSSDENDKDEVETQKKLERGKKRAAENAFETPASDDKKAKVAPASAQKTGWWQEWWPWANNDKPKSPQYAVSVQ